MYDLNETIRIIRSNTYSLDSGGLLEIRCKYGCHHSSWRRIMDCAI